MKNLIRKFLTRWLKSKGFSDYSAEVLFNAVWNDFFKEKLTTLSQKFWAYRRGFYSRRIPYFGLTDSNYRDYLSDFDYFHLHPINGPYSKWIDDKLTIKYILHPFANYLPGYYFHIYNHEILRLEDCPAAVEASVPGIIQLLKAKGSLSAKLLIGAKGAGFFKLAYQDQAFFINNQDATEMDVSGLIYKWLNTAGLEYLVTEYLQEQADLNKFSDAAPGTLRLVVIRERNQSPWLIQSFHRFATKKSGVVNNPGGVSCIVDVGTGFFSNGKIRGMGKLIDCKHHPDTGVLLEGYLPHWNLIKEKIVEISSYIPQLRYMGYDVIITEDGFKIIEINSHQGTFYLQSCHPYMQEGAMKEFFTRLLLEKKEKPGK